MSTTRDGEENVFQCDHRGCHVTWSTRLSFRRAWMEMQRAGWYAVQFAGQWRHYCPDCAPEARKRAGD